MSLTVINGTNRINNKSINISKRLEKLSSEKGISANIVDLNNFTELFRGKYITLENSTKKQKVDINSIIASKVLIFVVPVYHHGIPSSLKNFLDIVNIKELLEGKIIGGVSASNSSKDSIRQTFQIINGIASYNQNIITLIPSIPMMSVDNIDDARLNNFLEIINRYIKSND